MNNKLLPIHRKIYKELEKIDKQYLRRWDIQDIVLSYRLKKDINGVQLQQIKNLLLELGLTRGRVEKIMRQISYKFKLGLDDAYEIEKELADLGLLRYTGDHKIILIKNSLVLNGTQNI